jgi:NAD-dependent DNA ligase
VQAVTRGDGEQGDDVTDNVLGVIGNIPMTVGGNTPSNAPLTQRPRAHD